MIKDNLFPKPAYNIHNSQATSACLLTCEHASNYIPEHYNHLGLNPNLLNEHIAWDLGAESLTKYLADQLSCVAVLCQYSRLLIDCNRPLEANSSILTISEHHYIPGNDKISPFEKSLRIKHIFEPFHQSVAQQVSRLKKLHHEFPLIGIHSFTPTFKNQQRHWQFSVMWKDETPFVNKIIHHFKQHPLHHVIGFNEPYSAKEIPAYTTEQHADKNHLPNVIFEVRQDLLQSPSDIRYWGDLIKQAMDKKI